MNIYAQSRVRGEVGDCRYHQEHMNTMLVYAKVFFINQRLGKEIDLKNSILNPCNTVVL